MKFLLVEVKEAFAIKNQMINEMLFVNKMLPFYANSKEIIPFKELKVFFYELLNDIKANTVRNNL